MQSTSRWEFLHISCAVENLPLWYIWQHPSTMKMPTFLSLDGIPKKNYIWMQVKEVKRGTAGCNSRHFFPCARDSIAPGTPLGARKSLEPEKSRHCQMHPYFWHDILDTLHACIVLDKLKLDLVGFCLWSSLWSSSTSIKFMSPTRSKLSSAWFPLRWLV